MIKTLCKRVAGLEERQNPVTLHFHKIKQDAGRGLWVLDGEQEYPTLEAAQDAAHLANAGHKGPSLLLVLKEALRIEP